MYNIIKAANSLVQIVFQKNNSRMDEEKKKIAKIDPIRNFSGFKEYVKTLKNSNKKMVYRSLCSESFYYGHLYSLCQYAGIQFSTRKLYPLIEHGVNFTEYRLPTFEFTHPKRKLFQGKYKLPFKDAYEKMAIGPYTRYVNSLSISESVLEKKMGEQLIVFFPSHSYELSSVQYDINKYISCLQGLQKSGNRIVVCAYWHDVDNEFYTRIWENGIPVVSAGVRFDPLFISRLKSIIQSADIVFGEDLGTYIGYAFDMGKKVALTSDTLAAVNIKVSCDNLSPRAVTLRNALINQDEDAITSLVDYFWGTSIDILPPQAIQRFLTFN